MAWNSLPDFDFIRGIQRAAQTVLCIYLKRTCSRDTGASSALGVLNDYTLYKSTHSLTQSLLYYCFVNKTRRRRRRRSSLLTTPIRQSTSRGCLLQVGQLLPCNSDVDLLYKLFYS